MDFEGWTVFVSACRRGAAHGGASCCLLHAFPAAPRQPILQALGERSLLNFLIQLPVQPWVVEFAAGRLTATSTVIAAVVQHPQPSPPPPPPTHPGSPAQLPEEEEVEFDEQAAAAAAAALEAALAAPPAADSIELLDDEAEPAGEGEVRGQRQGGATWGAGGAA